MEVSQLDGGFVYLQTFSLYKQNMAGNSSHVAGNENTPWLDPGGEPDWGISVSFSACSTGKIVVQLDPPSERC